MNRKCGNSQSVRVSMLFVARKNMELLVEIVSGFVFLYFCMLCFLFVVWRVTKCEMRERRC